MARGPVTETMSLWRRARAGWVQCYLSPDPVGAGLAARRSAGPEFRITYAAAHRQRVPDERSQPRKVYSGTALLFNVDQPSRPACRTTCVKAAR